MNQLANDLVKKQKGSFSDLDILEICQQVRREEYKQVLAVYTKTINMEKQEPPNLIETQKASGPCTTKDYVNIPQKPRLGKVSLENEKVNSLLRNIPTNNITKLNKLFFAGVKLVDHKIGVLLNNPTEIQHCDGKCLLEDK